MWALIVVVTLLLRLVNINSSVQGYYVDEASLAFNAKSILETGTDEYGKSFPLAFRSFGDYKTPLFVYSAMPFVGLWGAALGIRLTSIFWSLMAFSSSLSFI